MKHIYLKGILLSLCLLAAINVSAADYYDVMIDGIFYRLIEPKNTATVISGTNSNYYYGNVVIPEVVTYNDKTYSVTIIGNGAFKGCSSLTSITIPNSVTDIVQYAFQGCSGLTSVTIPYSVKFISQYAFSGCSGLTSVTIPNSVKFISQYAFSGCSGLTSVTIPNSVTDISEGAFHNCRGLTSITIPESVTSIGSRAFQFCSNLKSIVIPSGVTTIGNNAFSGCYFVDGSFINNSGLINSDNWGAILGIEEKNDGLLMKGDAVVGCRPWAIAVTIPNGVTGIGDFAFAYCAGLTSVNIPNSVTSIGNSAFSYCSSLTSVTIPNSVTSIGEGAFCGCSSLTSITIPNSVTSIGESTFYGCTGLTSIAIPESVTSIGESAFYGCTGITSITIPESVKSIGDCAFCGCTGLISIAIPESVTDLGRYAFYETAWYDIQPDGLIYIGKIAYEYKGEMSEGTHIAIKEGTAIINQQLFCGYSALASVSIPNSVTTIGEGAFQDCYNLTSITIPNSVTTIGDVAFECCLNLTSITIPNSVTSIGESAFYCCTSLTSITIPSSVTSISGRAFRDCTSLTSITIPESVTSIGEYAFYGCTSLTSIIIPNCVTSIGISAFAFCYNLTSVSIPQSLTSISNDAFYGCGKLTSVEFHCPRIYNWFSRMSSIKQVIIGNEVTSISNDAFSGCTGLTSVEFHCSRIDNWFNRMYSISQVIIGNEVRSIANDAFPPNATIYTTVGKPLLVLWNTGYDGIKEVGTGRSLGVPTLSVTKATASSLAFSVTDEYPEYTNTLMVSGLAKTLQEDSITFTGLDPDTQIDELSLTLSLDGVSYTTNPFSFRTEALTLTTLQPKVISEGNVIVAASSNLDDEETNIGFEWRKIDWTDEFDSKTGVAYLCEGMMEGYIRSVNSNYLWKFRPFYTSNAGNTYYGEWKGMDPSDYSYFEPTVHTYADINVTGNSAEVKGYAMRGTDNVTSQGFMYWENNSSFSLRRRVTTIPDNVTVVRASGNVMTATLEDLEYETLYSYVAFVTTSEGETFYGEVQTFSTDVDPDGIKEVNGSDELNGHDEEWYDLQGRKLDKPQRGINILRMSDGSTRKVLKR